MILGVLIALLFLWLVWRIDADQRQEMKKWYAEHDVPRPEGWFWWWL